MIAFDVFTLFGFFFDSLGTVAESFGGAGGLSAEGMVVGEVELDGRRPSSVSGERAEDGLFVPREEDAPDERPSSERRERSIGSRWSLKAIADRRVKADLAASEVKRERSQPKASQCFSWAAMKRCRSARVCGTAAWTCSSVSSIGRMGGEGEER